MISRVNIVGGGLAGSEAAWQLIQAGIPVRLFEMRPVRPTAAHHTEMLAELVCSNSLKSIDPDSAPGLLKSEMRRFNSLVLQAADKARVPAGGSLAVERTVFSKEINDALMASPLFELVREEVTTVPTESELTQQNECWIIATGPLTSPDMMKTLADLCGEVGQLHFYDAIAPIIETETIDSDLAYWTNRYGKGSPDYLNVPLTEAEYHHFIEQVGRAEYMPLHSFENTKYFEACLPIEVMVERGPETLRFGPMKPVGLVDPKTGKTPYAAIQLRKENKSGTMVSMVGFQTKMKWPEQKRVFQQIPALRDATFFRFGSVHRNAYLESPKVLSKDFSFRRNSRVFLAGQVTGVEGYTESAAIGLLVGQIVSAKARSKNIPLPPNETMLGALAEYVTSGPMGPYQPMNTNFGLLPPIPKRRRQSKAERRAQQCATARQCFDAYFDALNAETFSIISRNDAGSKDAPPMRAPSTSV